MTTGGWILLILSIGTVLWLFFFCLYRLLRRPNKIDHIHGTIAHTPDMDKDDE